MDDIDTQGSRYGYTGWWTRLHITLAEVGPGPTPPAWYCAEKLRALAAYATLTAEGLERHDR